MILGMNVSPKKFEVFLFMQEVPEKWQASNSSNLTLVAWEGLIGLVFTDKATNHSTLMVLVDHLINFYTINYQSNHFSKFQNSTYQ